MDFCHLHVHTQFSYLDGFGTADNYAKRAKELGQKFIASTDHGNIDGLVKFQKACEKQGVVPIHGCEAYIVRDMTLKSKGEKRAHITLLVRNKTGWENLGRMLTLANTEGFYYKPRIDYNLLLKHCEGLVILTGCTSSFLNYEDGESYLQSLSEACGENLFLEVMPHISDEQIKLNERCIELSQKYQIPIVGTNDCHYILGGDSRAQEVLLAIQSKAKWNDKDRWKFNIQGLYLKSAEEMISSFVKQGVFTREETECILDWTTYIAECCSGFKIEKQEISLPAVPGYENEKPEFIWKLAEKRLLEISQGWPTEKVNSYFARLTEEWGLINKKGFAPYFMIIWELCNWCRENKIEIGPGRGSAGGSLMAYLLNITRVDPIKYGLLFSRFIAEDRIDLPDVDLDFEDRKRHLIREHLEALYGADHIASLSTFFKMKGRGVIRDVSRVFDVPLKDVDEFAKTIEETEDDTGAVKSAMGSDIAKRFIHNHPMVCDVAMKLEGQYRGAGQHAAALIISKESLHGGTKGNVVIRSNEAVCNWDMQDSEYIGLMKLDVLGLNTLSVLNEARFLINRDDNEKLFLHNRGDDCFFVGIKDDLKEYDGHCCQVSFDYDLIPLNDQAVYQSIYEGNTVGVFQMSTWATTNLAKQIRATNINELSDIIALVRPGPLDSGLTEEYIQRKNGKRWRPKNNIYEEITKNTFGVIVYQEQIMEVINKVAGLSYVTADKIRKVISKKRDASEFKPYEDAFVDGCIKKKTFSKEEARDFWKMLQSHARYSFNLSHSVSYAILAYWTAYTKYYFPVEFICAAMTYGSDAKKEELINEAYRLGLEVVLPKVGISDPIKWKAKGNKLYVPFIEIKGIGDKMAYKCSEFVATAKQVAAPVKKTIQGFFKSKNNVPVEVKKKPTGKIETLLDNLGALGGEPKVNPAEYFDFVVRDGARKDSSLARLFPDAASEKGILSLDIPEGVIKGGVNDEHHFTVKSSLSRCRSCGLRHQCKAPVNPSPGIFNVAIVGEVPGGKEDEEGVGFIGRSGDLIWGADGLKAYNLFRSDFHVTNVVHCYPKETKTPTPEQIKVCSEKWLFEELREINCRLVLAMGNTGVKAFKGEDSEIKRLNGTTEWIEKIQAWVCWCIHPAAVLRNPNEKPLFKEGIKNFVKKISLLE